MYCHHHPPVRIVCRERPRSQCLSHLCPERVESARSNTPHQTSLRSGLCLPRLLPKNLVHTVVEVIIRIKLKTKWRINHARKTEGGSRKEALHDDITDIPGIRVGHDTNLEAGTGCTVILCETPAVGGVDVRGGAPATRETDLLHPLYMVQEVHAVVLTGGSAYGLDAASGVMRYLEEHNVGLDTGVARVPIVPAAAIFDLGFGSPHVRPDATAGYHACTQATAEATPPGNVGAGTGATVGKMLGPAFLMKGGLGSASM